MYCINIVDHKEVEIFWCSDPLEASTYENFSSLVEAKNALIGYEIDPDIVEDAVRHFNTVTNWEMTESGDNEPMTEAEKACLDMFGTKDFDTLAMIWKKAIQLNEGGE
jgi:hypothetical protein